MNSSSLSKDNQRDSNLLCRLKARSKEAFLEIYEPYKNLVFYKAFSVLNNREDAEDIVQEVYLRLMGNIDSLHGEVNFKSLLASMATNQAIDLYRKKSNHPETPDSDLVEGSGSVEKGSELELIVTLHGLLEKEDADIVALHVLYDYGFREIAEEKHETVGVIQGRYYKAIKILKKHYKEEGK